MRLNENLQLEIIHLYLDGMSAYAISNKLKINYRTAKRYTDALDQMIEEIKVTVVSRVFEEMKEKPSIFAKKIMQIQYNNEVKHAERSD